MDKPPQKKPTKKQRSNASFLKYSAIGFQMIAIIFLGVWGGTRLDEYLENNIPIFTLVFSLLGLGLGMFYMIRSILKK